MFGVKQRFYVLLLLCVGVCGLFINATLTDEDKLQKEFESYYRIYSLALPNTLELAGEKVPLHDPDVQERLDRELLTNVYWQSQTIMMVKRAQKYFPLVEQIIAQNGIPDDMKFVVLAESGLQNLISPAGATGYWQMLDGTAKNFGLEISNEVDERYHLIKSTQAACAYFKLAYAEFKSWPLVAASYNMGIDGLKKQLQAQQVNNYFDLWLNTETSRYVFRILALKEIVNHPKRFGFHLNHKYQQPDMIQVKVTQPVTDFVTFANQYGCTFKVLKLYNPWLRGKTLTPSANKTYYIELPKDLVRKSIASGLIQNDTIVY